MDNRIPKCPCHKKILVVTKGMTYGYPNNGYGANNGHYDFTARPVIYYLGARTNVTHLSTDGFFLFSDLLNRTDEEKYLNLNTLTYFPADFFGYVVGFRSSIQGTGSRFIPSEFYNKPDDLNLDNYELIWIVDPSVEHGLGSLSDWLGKSKYRRLVVSTWNGLKDQDYSDAISGANKIMEDVSSSMKIDTSDSAIYDTDDNGVRYGDPDFDFQSNLWKDTIFPSIFYGNQSSNPNNWVVNLEHYFIKRAAHNQGNEPLAEAIHSDQISAYASTLYFPSMRGRVVTGGEELAYSALTINDFYLQKFNPEDVTKKWCTLAIEKTDSGSEIILCGDHSALGPMPVYFPPNERYFAIDARGYNAFQADLVVDDVDFYGRDYDKRFGVWGVQVQ